MGPPLEAPGVMYTYATTYGSYGADCARACESFVDAGAHACAFMALGHANLVARSSTPEKPRPTLLFGKESVSHEGGRASVHPFNGFLELETNGKRASERTNERTSRFVSCLRAVTQSRKYIVIFDAAPGGNYSRAKLWEYGIVGIAVVPQRARGRAQSFAEKLSYASRPTSYHNIRLCAKCVRSVRNRVALNLFALIGSVNVSRGSFVTRQIERKANYF